MSNSRDLDITLGPDWLEEQIDRLSGWEYLNRYARGELDKPLKPQDLCDRIGVHKGYVHNVTQSIKRKLHGK